jgi:cytochrome c oxidase cbb3-type subunit III
MDAPTRACRSFDFSDQQIAGLVALSTRNRTPRSRKKGGRKGVDVSDLQTGNAEAGKQYFDGAGDAQPATRQPAILPGSHRVTGPRTGEQMLYPERAKSKVTVTLGFRPNDHRHAGIP